MPAVPGSETLSTAGLVFEVILKLGVVLVLIYASLYFLRRWQVGRPGGLPPQVTILETTRLSPRQALHLVRVGSQVMLIGATDHSLALLSEEVELVRTEALLAERGAAHPPAGGRGLEALPGFNALLARASQVVRAKAGSLSAPRD
jgi:flagellar biogenesis protein FliO